MQQDCDRGQQQIRWVFSFSFYPPNLQVQCKEGLKLENSRNKFRCRDGEWKPSVPRCAPRDCHVPTLRHATRVPGDVTHVPHGGQLRLTCHSGYRLAGLSTLRCDHGNILHFYPTNHFIQFCYNNHQGHWDPTVPLCVGVPCQLPKIKHGHYLQNSHRFHIMSCVKIYISFDKYSSRHSTSPG